MVPETSEGGGVKTSSWRETSGGGDGAEPPSCSKRVQVVVDGAECPERVKVGIQNLVARNE